MAQDDLLFGFNVLTGRHRLTGQRGHHGPEAVSYTHLTKLSSIGENRMQYKILASDYDNTLVPFGAVSYTHLAGKMFCACAAYSSGSVIMGE